MSKEYMYLFRYDIETKRDCAKLVQESDFEKMAKYLRNISCQNLKVYQIDFENELIGKVFEEGEKQ